MYIYMSTCGKLELIIGPMFSGKSTELIKRIRTFKVIKTKYIVIKPDIDIRYNINSITSHNQETEDCITIKDLSKLTDDIIKYNDVIIIDEGQFFKNLKNMVLFWVEKLNKHIIIGGLDGDFQRNKIGEILDLIPYADNYIKLTALCKYCYNGTPAIFSHRINNNNNEQIVIGNEESYVSLCRKHYIDFNCLNP